MLTIDEALAEIARIGLEPDDVGLELLQARLGRHVELGEHRLVDDAGLAEAMAGLEALDRRLDERIVDRAVAGDRIEIARGHEALAQRLHPRALRADLQIGARRAPDSSRPWRRDPDISGSRPRSPRRWRATGSASIRARPPSAATLRSSAAIPPDRRPALVAAKGARPARANAASAVAPKNTRRGSRETVMWLIEFQNSSRNGADPTRPSWRSALHPVCASGLPPSLQANRGAAPSSIGSSRAILWPDPRHAKRNRGRPLNGRPAFLYACGYQRVIRADT